MKNQWEIQNSDEPLPATSMPSEKSLHPSYEHGMELTFVEYQYVPGTAGIISSAGQFRVGHFNYQLVSSEREATLIKKLA